MMIKSVLAAATCTLSLVACVKQDDGPPDLDRALPTADQVSIKLPEKSARTLDSLAVGQLANWYVATRDVTRTFNGGSAWVLTLVHTIVQFPATSSKGDVFTWGPWSDALNPAEYKLEVKVVGNGTYAYLLSGRSKTQSNAAFEVVIDGTADPRAGEAKGSGEFLIDFDASRRVNPVDSSDAKGSVDVNYDLARGHLDLTVMSTDDQNKPVIANYAYNETAAGGDMTFNVTSDFAGSATALKETLTLRSRWIPTGAGRADARIAGGDLGTVQLTASECWNTMFNRVFYKDSVNLAATEGAESACAFATQDLPLAP
ncbi:MAG TPA: hypothetical protein VGD37_35135 [Kofleriaceae bacterium]